MGAAVGGQRRGRTEAGAGGRAGTPARRTGNLSRPENRRHPRLGALNRRTAAARRAPPGTAAARTPLPGGAPREQGTELPAFTHLPKPLAPGGRFPSGAWSRDRGEGSGSERSRRPRGAGRGAAAARPGVRGRHPGGVGELRRRSSTGPILLPRRGLSSAAGPGNRTCCSC